MKLNDDCFSVMGNAGCICLVFIMGRAQVYMGDINTSKIRNGQN